MKLVEIESCNICGSKKNSLHTTGTDYEYETSTLDFHYVNCDECGHLFLKNVPDVQELPVIYPDNYQPYQFESALNPVVKFMRDKVQMSKVNDYKKYIPAKANIIEIGSGSGILIESLKRFGPETWDLTANEFEEKRLERLKGKGIHFKLGNFETIAFEKKYDCIIMNQLIEHLYNPDAILIKCKEILNHGGIVIIETPNFDSLDHQIFKNKYWGGYHIPRHFNIYSDKTLQMHLEKQGFAIVRQEFLLSPAFWVQSMHHLFFDKKIPFSKFWSLNNIPLTAFVSGLDLLLKTVWKTSNQRVVARV